MKHEPTIAGVSALLLVAASAAGAAPAAGPAGPRAAETPSFLDGARRVSAERLGPRAKDPAGRALAPVRLRYAGRDLVVDALVGGAAIAELEPGADAALAEAGVRRVRPLMESAGLWLVEGAEGSDGLDVAARLGRARGRGVREVFPDLYLRLTPAGGPYTPNDPRFPGQWYFESLRMAEAWGLSQGDPGTTIVVNDTGCDPGHPDLAAKMDPGLDVVDGDDDPSPLAGALAEPHGTECAGLVAAATDNGEGIAGGCPACRLRCVRLLADVETPLSATVDAFNFALEVDAAVVSNSWNFTEAIPVPKVVEDAINNVFDHGRGGRGALVIFAAGNDDRQIGDDELQAVRGVFAVGAINHLDEQTSFTNYGNALDVVAPTGTLTTDISGADGDDPGNYTSLFGGTSSACPVAAGAAALLASAAPDRTSAELYDVMTRTARAAPYAQPDGNGHDPIYGYGILDPVPALQEVLGLAEPAPAAEEAEDAGCACRAGGAAPGGVGALGAALYAAALGLLRARGRRSPLARRSR
jgi:subtilisin family serine protease